MFSRTTPVRDEGYRTGQWEKLSGPKSETSEDPLGSSGAKMALQVVHFEAREPGQGNHPSFITGQSLDMGGDWLWTRGTLRFRAMLLLGLN